MSSPDHLRSSSLPFLLPTIHATQPLSSDTVGSFFSGEKELKTVLPWGDGNGPTCGSSLIDGDLVAVQGTGSLPIQKFASPLGFCDQLLTFGFFQMPWGRPLSPSKKDKSLWNRETHSRPIARIKSPACMACTGTSRRRDKSLSWSHISPQQVRSRAAVSPWS